MKNLEKTYLVYGDTVMIYLEDLRDNYIYPKALGQIGYIAISKFGVMINQNPDTDELEIEKLRKQQLTKAFKEIFKDKKYDILSREYYDEILTMIEAGTLESLGYTRLSEELDEEIPVSYKRKLS